MTKISRTFEYSKLEKKAAKNLRVEEVIADGKNFSKATKFLKSQNFIPYKNIEKIVSLQKQNNFPIGYIMLNDSDLPVGYMGSWFSKRFIEGTEDVFCNIHTWIVDQNYRIYSFYLLSKIYHKNYNLIALTPVESLKGLLIKMGFIKKEIKFKLILNTNVFSFKKKNYLLVKNSEKIKDLLNKNESEIYNSFLDETYKKYIFYDERDKKNIFIIGCLIKKRKFKVFNLFYISDKLKFVKDYEQILNTISQQSNSLIFSEYILENGNSAFPDNIFFSKAFKKDIFIKSKNKFENIDLLNSDLVI